MAPVTESLRQRRKFSRRLPAGGLFAGV